MARNIIIVLIILAILYFGQQPYFEKIGRGIYEKIKSWVSIIWQKCYAFFQKHLFSKVTSEIEKREEIAKQEIKEQTREVGQNIWEKIKNYIWGFFSGIFKNK